MYKKWKQYNRPKFAQSWELPEISHGTFISIVANLWNWVRSGTDGRNEVCIADNGYQLEEPFFLALE